MVDTVQEIMSSHIDDKIGKQKFGVTPLPQISTLKTLNISQIFKQVGKIETNELSIVKFTKFGATSSRSQISRCICHIVAIQSCENVP